MQVANERRAARRRADPVRVLRARSRGGYRDIPLRDGRVDQRRVGARGRARATGRGGCTELGCTDAAGHVRRRARSAARRASSGTTRARDEVAHVRDPLHAPRRSPVAYDDVVDVNLKVWGDEWDERPRQADRDARRARARSCARGAIRSTCAATCSSPASACCCARSTCPAHQFVELRALDPARGVHLDGGDARRARATASRRSSAEERADAAAYERDHERIEHAKRAPVAVPRSTCSLLGARPGAARRRCAVFWFFGRERRTGYDREYEQEPPTDTAAGARADAAAPGRRGRVVRVHRDAVRPDPPRRLHVEAGDDGAVDLGRPPHGAGRRPRDLGRQRRRRR